MHPFDDNRSMTKMDSGIERNIALKRLVVGKMDLFILEDWGAHHQFILAQLA